MYREYYGHNFLFSKKQGRSEEELRIEARKMLFIMNSESETAKVKTTKNLQKKEGFKNRHLCKIPDEKVTMKVVVNDAEGEHIMLCEWNPFNEENSHRPYDGYLGTAKVIAGSFKGIGFHAWKQNNSEFIYYSLVEGV